MQEKPKERRISKACDQCSRFRRKCNGQYPCSLCVEKGRICGYNKPTRKRGPEAKTNMPFKPSMLTSKLVPPAISVIPVAASPNSPAMLTGDSTTLAMSPFAISVTTSMKGVDPFLLVQTPSSTPASPVSNRVLKTCIPKVFEEAIMLNSVANWTREDFLRTRVVDGNGNIGSIVDMYFSFPYQHIPMFSKLWVLQNIEDIPLHCLHTMYMLVLGNERLAVPNGKKLVTPHVAFVRKIVDYEIDDCDPFMIATLINLALYDFYVQDDMQSVVHISMAIKSAQMLGIDRDIEILWPSAAGRIIGNEIGMDKQFLRSMWFLLYHWDHFNILIYQKSMLIDTPIAESVSSSYISPNIGDSSNIPLNFLTHSRYLIPLLSLSKQICTVDSHMDRVNLLYKLDAFYLTLPISFIPQSIVFLGSTVNCLSDIFHFSKFCLLVPLYLDPYYIPLDRSYVPNQLEISVNAMLLSAMAFISYSNNHVQTDQSFLFFSQTLFVAALTHCMLKKVQPDVLGTFVEAIRLSGRPQNYDLLWAGQKDPERAVEALVGLFAFN